MDTKCSAVKPTIFVNWSSAAVAEAQVIVAGDLGDWWFSVGLDKKSKEVTVDPAWFSADRITAKPDCPASDEHSADLQAAKAVFESVKEDAVQMLMATLGHAEKDYSKMVRNSVSVSTVWPMPGVTPV